MAVWVFERQRHSRQGPAHPGIEHYTGARTGAMVRECLQNSLDAHAGGMVSVEIELNNLPVADFAGGGLAAHMRQAAASELAGDHSAQFTEAASLLDGETVPALVVKDSGTTGTRDSGGGGEGLAPWKSLTVATGVSAKPDTPGAQALGSFGIGKFAPYACTPLRTVLYSTCFDNDSGAHAHRFGGRTVLVSHTNRRDENVSGTGFLFKGSGEGSERSLEDGEIPAVFRLRQPGTAVWMPGYRLDSKSGWAKTVQSHIADNFFWAVLNGKLEVVVVGEDTGDQFTVCAEELKGGQVVCSEKTRRRVEVCSGEPRAAIGIEGLGEATLWAAAGDQEPGRSYALVRHPGLLITDTRDGFGEAWPGWKRHWQNFTAVCVIEPGEGDSVLRDCEAPAHDRLGVDRITCPAERAKALRALKRLGRWLHKKVAAIAEPHVVRADESLSELEELELVIEVPGGGPRKRKVSVGAPKQVKRSPRQPALRLSLPSGGAEEPDPDGPVEGPGPAPVPGQSGQTRRPGRHSPPGSHRVVNVPNISLRPVFTPAAGKDGSHLLGVSFRSLPPEAAKVAPEGLEVSLRAVFEDGGGARVPIGSVLDCRPADAVAARQGRLLVSAAAMNGRDRISLTARCAERVDRAAHELVVHWPDTATV